MIGATSHNGISPDYSLIEKIDFPALFKKLLSDNSQIEIVDLKTEAAFDNIADFIKKNPEIPVLAVNASSWSLAVEAIKTGASGVLDTCYPLDKVDSLIEAIKQSSVFIKSAAPFAIVFPRSHFASEIETLQYQIASQILNYWRSGEPLKVNLEDWQLDSLPKQLQQNSQNQSLLQELSLLMENFKEKQPDRLLEQSKQASKVLDRWFYSSAVESNSGLTLIRQNFWRLQATLKDKLWQTTLFWERTCGTYELSFSLKQIIENLSKKEVDVARSHFSASRISYSTTEACSRFQNKLAHNPLPEDYQSFIRGLKRQYQMKIKSQTSSFGSLLIGYMIEFIRDYRQQVLATDNLLYNLQQEITQNLSANSLEVVVHDPLPWQHLRSELTKRFGSFAYWGSREAAFRETLKAEIVTKAKGLAYQFILESYL